jgi:hypothetical protein
MISPPGSRTGETIANQSSSDAAVTRNRSSLDWRPASASRNRSSLERSSASAARRRSSPSIASNANDRSAAIRSNNSTCCSSKKPGSDAYAVSTATHRSSTTSGKAAKDRYPRASAASRHGGIRSSAAMSVTSMCWRSRAAVPVGPRPSATSRTEMRSWSRYPSVTPAWATGMIHP